MKLEVKVPSVGESITEGVLMSWLREDGAFVRRDDDLFEFETEKASVTVPSPGEGTLGIIVGEGTTVKVGQVVATIDTEAAVPAEAPAAAAAAKEALPPREKTAPAEAPSPAALRNIAPEETLSPAVRRIVGEHNLDTAGIAGTGKGGRITKGDVLERIGKPTPPGKEEAPASAGTEGPLMKAPVRRVPMSPVRKSIAARLTAARREAAHLTTFNEIDMSRVLDARKRHQERFEKQHGIKLGIMSFFVKAAVEALKEFPVINARIEGDDIVYYDFYDIGVAVSTDRGLLVPVLRDADRLGFAAIEKQIADLARRAQEKKIALHELQGGTFSITNGGVFGSLMSTPIPNHPQPAILGMHAIKDRPVAVEGEVKIRPMMYVALTYDHRLIDGKDAVSFLVRIRERIEDPEELLLAQ